MKRVSGICFRYIGIILLIMIIGMSGCTGINSVNDGIGKDGTGNESTNTSTAAEDKKGAFVGSMDQAYFMCVFVQGAAYWKGVYQGFKAAGDQLGVRTVFTGCDEYDPNAQLRVFEQIVAKKPKGIALSPINPDIFNEAIDKATAAGIMVTTFASDSPDSKRLTLVTSDNVTEGRYAADYIAEKLGGNGEVGIIERPNQTNHAKRVKAFMDRLEEKYPGMKVVARDTADGDETKAARIAKSMTKEFPGLDLIFCVAGIEGMGAATGVKESGMPVKVFCYDADPKVIDMIKDGTIYAAIQPNVVNQGYWSMMLLYVAGNNLIDPVSDWKQAGRSPLPSIIDNGLDVVTKDNCDSFYVK